MGEAACRAAAVFGGGGARWGLGGRGGRFLELAELAGSKVVMPVNTECPVFMRTAFAAFTGFSACVFRWYIEKIFAQIRF
ncbi:MAG: hypothetical protein WC742_11615 [Gallionellaceae bacterium]|jgi:hypothetical protein